MHAHITAEHFELPPEHKEHIEEIMQKFEGVVSPETHLHLFLKPETDETYKVILNLHQDHQDYAATAEGEDLLRLVRSTCNTLVRTIRAEKERKLSRRYRQQDRSRRSHDATADVTASDDAE